MLKQIFDRIFFSNKYFGPKKILVSKKEIGSKRMFRCNDNLYKQAGAGVVPSSGLARSLSLDEV